MPRVHTLKANKDYPEDGIKKGETYYKWKKRYGPVQWSRTYPRPTQLSDSKMAVIEEAREDGLVGIRDATTVEEVESAVQGVGEAAREVADEYEDALSAWPNGNSQIEELRDVASSFADECDGWQSDEQDDEEDSDEEKERKLEQAKSDAEAVLDSFSY